jgi:putative heme-binding domain-containing protein
MSAEHYLLESILDPLAFRPEGETTTMPADASAGLSRLDVLCVAAWLSSETSGGQGSFRALSYAYGKVSRPEAPAATERIPDLATLDRGREIVTDRGKCLACHAADERPGFNLAAPNLFGAGRHDTDYLRESLREPSRRIVKGYESTMAVVEGQVIVGRMISKGPSQATLLAVDATGNRQLHRIDLSRIDPDEAGRPQLSFLPISSMPDYLQVLSSEDIEAAVAYLRAVE